MRRLSQDEALAQAGYLVVENALSPDAVTRLLRAFDSASVQGEGTQHVRIGAETPEREEWLALPRHPLIVAAAAQILRAPYRVDVHGRSPLPGFGQQGLHADAPLRAEGEPYTVLTALWMLDGFDAENGATRVVPGSHLIARPIPKALAQPLAVHPQEVIVCGSAGAVLIFNGHLWHSGRRNASSLTRRAVQMVLRVER